MTQLSGPVFVLDTNAVIDFKTLVPLDQQWEFFKRAEDFTRRGLVAFPVQVRREIANVRYPDAPGAWLVGVAASMKHAQPSDTTLAEVLRRAPGMVDPDAEIDRADPYVVAMAIDLRSRGMQVAVVSGDRKDRAGITSVATACGLFEITVVAVNDFIRWVNVQVTQASEQQLLFGDT